jgi:gamma-glutamyltranspeptidase / glutathione hydrolase
MGFARRLVASLAVATVIAVTPPAQAFQPGDNLPPEIATGTRQKPLIEAQEEMVVTANP